MIKGIDVSHYQGNIDFTKVKESGVEIVIIKATEGKTYQDPYFKTYYEAAKASGLKVGVYHFLRGNSPIDEVNNLLSVIDGLDFECRIVIDAEVDLGSVEKNSNQVRATADILKSKDYEVALYTGEYFYNNHLNDTVKDIPVWIANYGYKPKVSNIGWQFSSTSTVPGISGNVDMDYFEEGIFISKYLNKKYYIVTDYLLCGQYGVEFISLYKKYFDGLDRIYIRQNDKGIWIETQYLSKEAAESLAEKLKTDNLLWEMVEE